jgi:hypothetical protein
MHLIGEQQWIFIAVVFFGIIGYIAWMRWRDRKWIEDRFGSRPILAMSFGVNFFGRASESGKPRRSSGFLLLLNDALFYRSRVKKIELEIRGTHIARVYHDRTHKGVDLHQSLVKIDFLNDQNQKDTAAFKVPYPPSGCRRLKMHSSGKSKCSRFRVSPFAF